jgi:hypothetical protein
MALGMCVAEGSELHMYGQVRALRKTDGKIEKDSEAESGTPFLNLQRQGNYI